MHCEIICVGTEILLGDIIDTNSQYISKRLNEIGMNLLYHTTTGDNPKRLKAAFEEAYKRSDIVIATGGLGPTQDDLTKETAAEIMGLEMEVNDEWIKNLETIFKDRMTPNNLKQADIPKGAKMLYNKNGTAPGVLIENNEKTKAIILLPGPPREMIPMFDEYILPYLMEKSGKTFYSRYYKITNYGESALEHMLLDLVDKQSNPTIATYAKEDGILLRVTANAEKKEDADVLLQKYEDIIYQRVGDGIFATEDVSLSRVILNLLEERNLTLAVAESCTGGNLAAAITENPGSSKVFYGSMVTYSNEAKMRVLGVQKETLEQFGAVSEETVREMAAGIAKLSGADVAVAITGISGPEGGSEEKPVGLTYIAVAYKGQISCRKILYSTRRRSHQLRTSNYALNMVRQIVLQDDEK